MADANFETLKNVANETKNTLAGAARTIRALIIQRDDAIAGATPEAVAAAKVGRTQADETLGLQADLVQARVACEAAMAEAGVPSKAVPGSKVSASSTGYPKTLSNTAGAHQTVQNAAEEATAKSKGFVYLVP
jgi:hypothetical protein